MSDSPSISLSGFDGLSELCFTTGFVVGHSATCGATISDSWGMVFSNSWFFGDLSSILDGNSVAVVLWFWTRPRYVENLWFSLSSALKTESSFTSACPNRQEALWGLFSFISLIHFAYACFSASSENER
jgi:hypothetical protein